MRIPSTALYLLIPPAALAGLVVLWMVVGALLSWVGGWRSLAQDYARSGPPRGDDLGLCSISMSRGIVLVNYNRSVQIRLGQEGLALDTSSLFHRFHEPILIPWGSVERCERQKLLFQEATLVVAKGRHVEILVRGEAGARISEYWRKNRGEGRP